MQDWHALASCLRTVVALPADETDALLDEAENIVPGVEELVDSPLEVRLGVLYPAVMEELRELNSGKYVEAVLTGAIGTGKSTIALFTTAYQLLSLPKTPSALDWPTG
jgi:hypothetical protein